MASVKQAIPCIIRPAKDKYEVRDIWHSLTTELHWNRCSDDAFTHLYSASLDGWLMAIPAHTANREPYPDDSCPQGSVVVYKFPNATGWLSFFVTTAPYRGYGLGRELFGAGMRYLQKFDTEYIGLDSVPEQRGTYVRRDFVETDLVAVCERPNVKDLSIPVTKLLRRERTVDLATVGFEKLAKYDSAACGLERNQLWTYEALFHRHDVTGLAVLDQHDVLTGCVLVRKCELGYRFGPLYADRKDVASFLLQTAMENLDNKDARLIVEAWVSNADAVSTFTSLGWKQTGTFHRMWYNGKVPAAQSRGGLAETVMFAVFDAAQG